MTWLPKDYEAPKPNSNYFKLEDGRNKLRVISDPILGWVYWNTSGKPVRVRERPASLPEDIRVDMDGNPEKIKHFWAFTVWNYAAMKLQILEITQASIQGPITDLVTSEDWGDPKEYDLTITKKGQKLDTEYSVTPSPKTAVPVEAHAGYREARINLEALFDGADPFATASGSEGGEASSEKKVSESNPF